MSIRSVSRRQFLQGAAAFSLGAALLPLAGCGGAAGPVSAVPSDTVKVAYSRLAGTLDPHAWTTAAGPRTLAPLFDALTFVQSDGQLRPALAVAWSQPTPVTWQFKLRADDAKFSNGEFFTPDSVKLTIERVLDPANKLSLRPLLANVDRVEIINPWTINILTKEADPGLARKLSLVYMLPPVYFGRVGAAGFAQQPIGTGFWQLQDFQPAKLLRLGQFRDTWRGARGADPPPIDKLQLTVTADRAQALTELQVDVATELTPEQAKALHGAGFLTQTATAPKDDDAWQASVLGAALAPPVDVFATAANVKGVVAEPSGAWWFDRVTKTAMQRVAVAGGA